MRNDIDPDYINSLIGGPTNISKTERFDFQQRNTIEKNTETRIAVIATLAAGIAIGGTAFAQDADAVAEMARKAQDPLGDVKALMTDNTIGFGGGPDDDTTFSFQIQPVYAIDNSTRFNMILRAIVPIVGVEPSVELPRLGADPRPANGSTWGLSDTFVQYFLSPKSDGGIKWGFGPQVSLKTRSSDRQAGPGWGAGLAAVIFGGSGNWSFGGIANHHWGDEDGFSLSTVQVIALYNFESIPGASLGYNNSMTYNWKANSGEEFTLPLGLTAARTMLLGNGDGLELSIGAYSMVERPTNSPDWQLKFGVSYFVN